MSLYTRLASHAEAQPHAPCLLGDGGCDWLTFLARVRTLAARFAPHRGRVVAIALPDGPELATVLVACLVSGAIAFPIPAGATAYERAGLLAGLDAALVLDVAALTPFLAAPAEGPPPPEPAERDVAVLIATSGSTGAPKRVALTYGGLAWNAEAHADSLSLPAGVRTLLVTPITHAFPLVALLLATLLRGGACGWLAGPFTPRGLLKRVAELEIGYVSLAPTLLRLLMARVPDAAGLPAVLSVGAAPMPAAELAAAGKWAAARGCRLYHTYGLSEAGPRVATLAPEELADHADSAGRPLAGVALRVLADGRDCPVHVPGELWVKSPSVMAGYYPEGGGLADGGWLPTGDWGFLDEARRVHLRGRLKDVIVTGGMNVSAREVEEALLADARVAEAAVVGVPDADYGEVARAFVIAKAAVTPSELLQHLRGCLSVHKLPRSIVVLADLPRTALGKVDKRQLKEGACEGLR